MAQNEYVGWLRLATRVLDRIPTRGDGEVSAAIAALKKIAPPAAGATGDATGINTPEWYAVPVGAACEAAGARLVAESFTGG